MPARPSLASTKLAGGLGRKGSPGQLNRMAPVDLTPRRSGSPVGPLENEDHSTQMLNTSIFGDRNDPYGAPGVECRHLTATIGLLKGTV